MKAGVDVRRVIVKEKKRHRFVRGEKNGPYEESQELASDFVPRRSHGREPVRLRDIETWRIYMWVRGSVLNRHCRY